MQSWQADIVNTTLSLSLKPALARARSIRSVRRGFELGDKLLGRLATPRHARWKPVSAPGAPCEMEWLNFTDRDSRAPHRVVLYLPGGAFVLRTPQMHRSLAARLSEATDSRALLCFYRLAPEHPFPACLEEAVAAYRLLLSEGVQPEDIVVAGDSAGGGLTLSLLLMLRELELPQPAGAILISPLLDMAEQAPSRSKNARRDAALPPATRRGIDTRGMYAAGEDYQNPLLSPIHGDLQALPPCYVLVSDSEMLLDDSLRLARRAHEFRMTVKLDIWHKLPHVWLAFPWLPETTAALRRIGQFVQDLHECEPQQ